LRADRVADLGCGTGVLATDLAANGWAVTGIDPSPTMLAIARARTGADAVTWVEGFASALSTDSFDLVIMEGHVAQYFISAGEWAAALRCIRRSLRAGGRLAFESRNPAARAWESRNESATRSEYPHPRGGSFVSWVESVRLVDDDGEGPIETHRGHTVLPGGAHLVSDETLRFRRLPALQGSLGNARFFIEQAWGDWNRAPLSDLSPEFILVARGA
jgi:SAM-dependent methyltransferase